MEHCPGWIIDKDRKKWILNAIETKDLEFLRILAPTVHPFINTSEYLECAVGIEDNIPVIEYLVSLNCPVHQLKVLNSAVEKKAFNNLKFFHENMEFPIDDNYRVFNIEMMEYLKSHSCPIRPFDSSKSAARHGALNNLKWLLKNGFLIVNEKISRAAMKSGSLEVLKWLKENKCPIYSDPRDVIFENCLIKTMEWLIEQKVRIIDTLVVMGAAEHGSFDKMKWLLKKNYSIKDSMIF